MGESLGFQGVSEAYRGRLTLSQGDAVGQPRNQVNACIFSSGESLCQF